MKIGVGIITCNRQDYLTNLLTSIHPCEDINELVIVNDGLHIDNINFNKPYSYILNETNVGVAKSKNKAMKHLLDTGCDYIFIIEDDMIILEPSIFSKYIEAHISSGIHHFNYGPGSPFNRKQTIQNFDLHNRHLLDQHTEPNPKLIVDYGNVKVSLFEHTVAMFSFFTKEVLEKVGFIDESYFNAWEHVDHTYCIIKAGYHPPFWWFADLYESHKYITESPNAINNSSIANNTEQWQKNVSTGRDIYKQKHGHYPNQPPFVSKDTVIELLNKLKKNKHAK